MKHSVLILVILLPLCSVAMLISALYIGTKAALASSSTFIVNSTIDAVDINPGNGICETDINNGICTLRAAIQEANATPGLNKISLPNGIYNLTIEGIDEDNSATGDLDISDDLIINGTSVNHTIINANEIDRVIHTLGYPALSSPISVEINNVTLNNGANNYLGGGILNNSYLSLDNTSVYSSTAGLGGGLYTYNHPVTITNGYFGNNNADNDGGGIYNDGSILNIDATEVISNSAGRGGGIFINYYGSIVTVTNSHINENYASYGGAGIQNGGETLLYRTSVSHNHRGMTTVWNGSSSGITNQGALHLIESTVSYNTLIPTGSGASGIGNEPLKTLIIERSTLSYNNSIALDINSGSMVEVKNSTLSHNGGDAIFASESFTISNSTLYSNTNGIGIFDSDTTLYSYSNIFANQNKNCRNISGGPISSLGYNLDSDGTCNFDESSDILNEHVLLGPLQDNGGSTETHILLEGSPAIDTGDDIGCPNTDQRNLNRPIGSHCDIGAVEYNPTLIAIDDETNTKQNISITIDALKNDMPGKNGHPSLNTVGTPLNGTTIISGSFILYTPTLDFIGTDYFTYTITDGVDIDSATITVTVTPPIPPTAVPDEANTTQRKAIIINVLQNDLAGDNGDPYLNSVGSTSNGSTSILGSNIIYTPSIDFVGSDVFNYIISDGILTDTTTVTVTVYSEIFLPAILKP